MKLNGLLVQKEKEIWSENFFGLHMLRPLTLISIGHIIDSWEVCVKLYEDR